MGERDDEPGFPQEADTKTAHVQLPIEDEPDEDTTQVHGEPPVEFAAMEDDLTVSLQNRSAVRDVYRLFLDSEHAPALALADDLIAKGETDPMLVAIARECRTSLENDLSRPREDAGNPRGPVPTKTWGPIAGTTTLEEVARLARTPLAEVIALLERLIALGARSERPTE